MKSSRLLAVQAQRPLPEASDKCVLPQAVLESILQEHGGGELPIPLTFSLVSVATGRRTHIGVQEFNAQPGQVILPAAVLDNLGMTAFAAGDKVDGLDWHLLQAHVLDLQLVVLPKGEYVLLRPLASGYDLTADWKTMLEGAFRSAYTTLTRGDVIRLKGRSERFLIDELRPDEQGVCIIDTDLEVDLRPLSDQHAQETLDASKGTKTAAVALPLDVEMTGTGNAIYNLTQWDRERSLVLTVRSAPEVDLVADREPVPVLDRHIWSDLQGLATKRIEITPSNAAIEEIETLYLGILADTAETQHFITASQPSTNIQLVHENRVRCSNCEEYIPSTNLFLHERHCARINKRCTTCGLIQAAHALHNHCDICNAAFACSQAHHDARWHTVQTCSCLAVLPNLSQLAVHRAMECPDRPVLCRFCQLPQSQGDLASVAHLDRARGLNAHEAECGARTIACEVRGCHRLIQLKQFATHEAYHAAQRARRALPRICANEGCVSSVAEVDVERTLGLCGLCFGPLHNTALDDAARSGLWRRVQRRILLQLLTGCRRPGCGNHRACATAGFEGDRAAKQAEAALLLARAHDQGEFVFCVSESMHRKAVVAEMLAAEGVYEPAWCARAAEVALGAGGDGGDPRDFVRAWLAREAPTMTEAA